jgi:hypothetical protein
MSHDLCSLTECSIYGRAESTESNACIRRGIVMARIIRACAVSEGRSRGSRRDGIPCGWYAVLLQLAILAVNGNFTEDLTSKKRYIEAAHVLLDYTEDIREAVITLVQGNQFSEARHIVS